MEAQQWKADFPEHFPKQSLRRTVSQTATIKPPLASSLTNHRSNAHCTLSTEIPPVRDTRSKAVRHRPHTSYNPVEHAVSRAVRNMWCRATGYTRETFWLS